MITLQRMLLFWLVFSFSDAYSQLELPSVINHNMVLQQNDQVPIWGSDEANHKIRIITGWGEMAETQSNQQGNWKLTIPTPGAGGPYQITIEGSEKKTLYNILIGEVWLCSGQSNMEMPLKGYRNEPVSGGNKAILGSGNDAIRFFNVKKNASLEPVVDCKASWVVSAPSTSAEFSATAYFFGKLLHEILDVPVGLISSHWGGSNVQAWIDEPTLMEAGTAVRIPEEILDRTQHTPAVLYNGMIHPVIPFGIKGAIWYQGESNVNEPDIYEKYFPLMVENWRTNWQRDSFPFYYVQIAPYRYWNREAAPLREVQLQAMDNIPNSGMVVTTDIGDCQSIHPPEKKMVGERLAFWALGKTYGLDGFSYEGPVLKSTEIKGDTMMALSFDNAAMGLYAFGKPLDEVTIAGRDRVFYPAKARIIRDREDNNRPKLLVWSKNVPEPVAVRYAWSNCPDGALYNTSEIPASPFRTDDW